MATDRPPKRGVFTGFLSVACTVLLALVVLLARQNVALKARSDPSPPETVDALDAGEEVGPFAVVRPSGETSKLAFGEGEDLTLLMVFSAHCPACQKTLPLWEKLARELGSRPGLRVVGVQTDPPGDGQLGEAVGASVSFDVLPLDLGASTAMRRIPFIPATIVVNARGIVERIWFGVPSEGELDTLRESLGA